MEPELRTMPPPTEVLWWLSHEYGQRLSKAGNYIELLASLVADRVASTDDAALLAGLQEAHGYLETVRDEFRGWRYAFLYETPDSRRIVQAERAVQEAIDSFQRMRGRQLEFLTALNGYFVGMPSPDPRITTVPTGDMWGLLLESLDGLVTFDQDQFGAV
jgi:hypothetical protein